VAGPVLGAVVMSIVKEALSTSVPHFQPIIFGVLVIVLILWCPGGIIQAFGVARSRLRSWSRPRIGGAVP
jgi:ABC-type branched-subunit amino acid transport system permease subunit